MRRFVDGDEAYGGNENGPKEVGYGNRLDEVIAELLRVDEERKMLAQRGEKLETEAQKLLEALHERVASRG